MLEPLLRKIIDQVANYCQQLLKVPNYEYLTHCIHYLAASRENDDWIKENMNDKDTDDFEVFIADNLEIKDVNIKEIIQNWNKTNIKDRKKAFDILMNLYSTQIKPIADKINEIYSLEELLDNWNLLKENQYFEIVEDFLFLGIDNDEENAEEENDNEDNQDN